MGTLNYTTMIAADRTAAEMHRLLAKHGASAVATLYADGHPSGLAFTLPTPHGERQFQLPINVEAVHRLLTKQANTKTIRRSYSTAEQAERTAWRVAKDWLAAQMAIVEAQMAALDEVMLPYLVVNPVTRQTLYAKYREKEASALQITTGDEDV